jgi:hypothetical protein
MYHYVRNNESFSYDCFARRFSEFESQVDFLSSNFDIISPGDFDKINYYLLHDNQSACMLTFDDGYKDHYACSRFLHSKNFSAIFFPPLNALNGELLDINAIHYLIGLRGIEIKKLLNYIVFLIKEKHLKILSWQSIPLTVDDYLKQVSDDRYNDSATVFVKRLLQRDIVGDINRRDVLYECLKYFAGITPDVIAVDLYLTHDEMKTMHSQGMHFGSHGISHRWLATLSKEEQYIEISTSFCELERLTLLNSSSDPKVMCFPFGSYNMDTLHILNQLNVDYAFTTHVGAASLLNDGSMYRLQRWDTNDFWDSKWRRPSLPNSIIK